MEQPSLYLDQVAVKLFDRTEYSMSISRISKLLKSKGYTLKKMELHARSASKLDQQRFIDEIIFRLCIICYNATHWIL